MKNNKKATVSVVLLSTLMYFMIVLNVIESPLYYEEFSNFKNFIYPSVALWNSVITIFTVGYGDIYVVTYFGRILISIMAIFSSIILSFITVAITTDFDF